MYSTNSEISLAKSILLHKTIIAVNIHIHHPQKTETCGLFIIAGTSLIAGDLKSVTSGGGLWICYTAGALQLCFKRMNLETQRF